MSPHDRQHPVRKPWSVRVLRPHPLTLAVAMALASTLPGGLSKAQTLPAGARVVSGQAAIVTQGSQMTINNSRNAVLNWQSFSIGAGQSVRFEQPDASSRVLNRVLGRDPSEIAGRLSSNGGVWLLNPNGVLFGAGSRVDVAGLVASTLNINDADWQSRRYSLLGGNSTGTVVNRGEIRTVQGGQVLLLGGSAGVRNEGLIEAPGGHVVLAAGASVDLADSTSPQLAVRVTALAGEALNLGSLLAPGGRVDLQAAMVNQQGIVRADGLAGGPGGEVRLSASGALTLSAGSHTSADGREGGNIALQGERTLVQGVISVDGSQGPGGSIRLLGQEVGLLAGARVSARGDAGGGEVLVGGGEQGKDASVPNARAVYMDAGATIRADAGSSGDGGRIILWSDEATRAYGALSARGGSQAGDGGFIETSGGWLDAMPVTIRTDAPAGKTGLWLLDPNNITIAAPPFVSGPPASNQNVTGSPNFTTTNDSAVIYTNTIESALNGGVNVSITTASGGTNAQLGNISLTGNLSVTPTSAASLTLNAAHDINIDQSISASGAPLNIVLNAGTGGSGGVTIGGEIGISTTGSFTAKGRSFNVNTASISAGRILIQSPSITMDSFALSATATGNAITLTGLSGNISSLSLGSGSLSVSSANNGRWLIYASNPQDSANFIPGGLSESFRQYAATYPASPAVSSGNGFLFSISPQLRVGGSLATPVAKTYDGSTSAPVNSSGLSLVGTLSGDSLSGGVSFGAFNYVSPSAGSGIGISASLSFGLPPIYYSTGTGPTAPLVPVYGYSFSPTSSVLFGDITPRTLTVSSVVAQDKAYDGTRSVRLVGSGFSGLVPGEALSLVPITAQFDTKDVGVGKSVVGSYALANGPTGSLASNYQLLQGGT